MRSRSRWMTRAIGLGAAATLILFTAGCGDDDSNDSSSAPSSATEVTDTTTADTDAMVTPTDAMPETTAPLEVVKLRMTTNNGLLQTLLQHVAIEQGFFEQNGIEIDLVDVASGPAGIQALLAGDAEIMLNAPDFVILANEQGQAVKMFVANFIRLSTTLVASPDWPLPNEGSYPEVIGDLKGATIGVVARGSAVENQLRVMLEDAGLDPDSDVTIVATGLLDTAIPALQAGQVDAWVAFEPGTTMTVEQLKVGVPVVDLRAGEGPEKLWNVNSNAFAAKEDYIEANPEVIRRFVSAIVAAQQWMQDPANREDLEAIATEHVNIDAASIPAMIDANLATFGAEITEERIQNSIDMMVKFGLVENPPAYEEIVATKFTP